LAAPKYKSTSLWTTSAIVLTNYITSFYKTFYIYNKTSVASVKFLISQNPNIATLFFPYIEFLIYPEKFLAIIKPPASPNPIASKAPIFNIVFSI